MVSEGRREGERSFGRDGMSGLVSPSRAMRAREVSRPTAADVDAAKASAATMIARAEGRR